MKHNDQENKLIQEAPAVVGCYIFKNENNNVVYVGKAKNIKTRVKQHVKACQTNQKTQAMFAEIKSWEFFVTNTEKEALILEHNLIKQYFPKFNIVLSDNQTYPYIFITAKSKNPKYFLVKQKKTYEGIYYGPFPNLRTCKNVLTLLQTLFPLKRCRKKTKSPCFYYHLNQCSGACFKEVPKQYYQQQLQQIKMFFRGQNHKIKQAYKDKIAQVVKNLQFEQAEEWQNLVNEIDRFVEKQTIEFNNYLNCDFMNFHQQNNEIVIVIFFYRQGQLSLKKEGLFNMFNNNINETVVNFLQEVYTYHPLPEEIAIPKGIDLKTFAQIQHIKVVYPKIGKKATILQLVKKNAINLMENKALHNQQTNKIQILKKLAKILNIKREITTIDFLDLSYLEQKKIVAGFTSYLNNNPVWNKNKIYQIENFKHDEKEYFSTAIIKHYSQNTLPDLLILDGGWNQIMGAEKAFKILKKTTNFIGMVKDDKHQSNYILKKNKTKILLPKNDPNWLFLSKIQSLGHLYVIKNLRQLNRLQPSK